MGNAQVVATCIVFVGRNKLYVNLYQGEVLVNLQYLQDRVNLHSSFNGYFEISVKSWSMIFNI